MEHSGRVQKIRMEEYSAHRMLLQARGGFDHDDGNA